MLTAAVLLQFWKEVVEDTEVRELIWDKSSAAQGKHVVKSQSKREKFTLMCAPAVHLVTPKIAWHAAECADFVYSIFLFSVSYITVTSEKCGCALVVLSPSVCWELKVFLFSQCFTFTKGFLTTSSNLASNCMLELCLVISPSNDPESEPFLLTPSLLARVAFCRWYVM